MSIKWTDADGNIGVTVEKGDTLWDIAKKYGVSVDDLAAKNPDIVDPDLIYPDQKINISEPKEVPAGKLVILQFGVLSTDPNTLFATWKWDMPASETESYKVQWTYNTGDGVWFVGKNEAKQVDEDDPDISRVDTYTIPSDAKQVRFKVKPIAKKKKQGDSEVAYWTANWSETKTYTDGTPLATPSTPSAEKDGLKYTLSLDNIDIINATHIQFQVVKNNSDKSFFAQQLAPITAAHASHVFTLTIGGQYKGRARAYNSKLKEYSDWSQYTDNVGTMPSAPKEIVDIWADSATSVKMTWTKVDAAESYEIEYATKEEYLGISAQCKYVNDIKKDQYTAYPITGLDEGTRYFFRVRAVNDDGESDWTEPKSVAIGSKPSAPTTWSSTTTAIVGEDIILYWVHNSEDGSRQTYADLEISVGGVKVVTAPIQYPETDEEEEKTSSLTIKTSEYVDGTEIPPMTLYVNAPEGTEIQWRVKTAGITKEFGDWSTQRTITVYVPPTLHLEVNDVNGNQIQTLTEFPFRVYGVPGPKTQVPTGFHVSIVSNSSYETTDEIGNPINVNVGDEVYSKYFDIQHDLLVELSAGNINLENDVEYTVNCTVSMDSGLTAIATRTFTVNWTDMLYSPDASISLNTSNLTATIRPYCEDIRTVCYRVTYENRRYTKTAEVLEQVGGRIVKGAKTLTGELVYSGATTAGESVYYCKVTERIPITDVYLAVYRREFDGSFTELASGLDGARNTAVSDPHPALDFARYRIVATSKDTGAVSFYDLPGYPVGGKSIVIQWDEDWTNFEVYEDAVMEQPAWTGSLLKLPYNVDVSDNNKSDVVLVEYIGRSHPISYYGTQIGQSATWNADIDKSDKETIYALRRLARWMGDVYVREPSGSGYWANITVSFNQKHLSTTIPVTLNVTRVEGGA